MSTEREYTAIAAVSVTERTSEPQRLRIFRRIGELVSYRQILLNLVRKELKVKYTASVLGAVWSLLNPIVFLGVFYFVVRVMGNNLSDFPVFLLSGLLAWNLFNSSLLNGARSMIDNANLVKKMAFPREILPLATIGVSAFDFLIQISVLVIWIIASGHGFSWEVVALFPLGLIALLFFTTAMTFWISALNVRYRDVQHLIGLGLLVWFWGTPIVYAVGSVWTVTKEVWGIPIRNLYLANPLAPIVISLQRFLYGLGTMEYKGEVISALPDESNLWYLGLVGAVLVFSTVLLWFTWKLFFRLSGDFAEEL